MHEYLAHFAAIFQGHENAYGIYEYGDTIRADGKLKGKGTTFREKLLPSHWNDHLNGTKQLGIIPINENSLSRFGAIDIDDYEVNRERLNKLIVEHKLPLIQFRSKSGGAHLFIFTNEHVPAALIQQKLKEIAAFLGYGNAEVFPKQTQLLKDRGDVGGWINMPYFNSHSSDRYALNASTNQQLKTNEFLDYIKTFFLSADQLQNLHIETSKEFTDGPPCLQHLVMKGFPEGTRNNGLFNLALYAKKVNPDKWKVMTEDYNTKYLSPQLSPEEVLTVISSVDKRDYKYTCKQQPLCMFCNATLCRSRKHGIGNSTEMPIFNSLTKIESEPPVWFMDVDGGGRLELTTEDLQTPLKIQRKCLDAMNIMIPLAERKFWQTVIAELLQNLTVVTVPKEATPRGLLMQLLEEFCTTRSADGDNPECLLRGLVYNHAGRHHFRINDFIEYLNRKRFDELSRNSILTTLRDHDVKPGRVVAKARSVQVYTTSVFEQPLDSYTPPKQTKGEIPF